MKKIFLLLLFITFVTVNANAQQPGDRMRSLEIGYITKELRLTPEEAEKFWPVYNKYKQELRTLPDTGDELERQQKVLNIRKKYKKGFAEILLDNNRAQAVYDAEDRLRNLVKRELEKRRERPRKFRNNE
ncbi:MAG: hypothetical protein KIT80_14065 [Chitinophagaceae bacterium]|nr:hypothetical protein [Chitinophagaceae bacterium]MCW5928037.1 hypothetical protein [Chitinophagaceae bacterium]